jgi:hypothetical protein
VRAPYPPLCHTFLDRPLVNSDISFMPVPAHIPVTEWNQLGDAEKRRRDKASLAQHEELWPSLSSRLYRIVACLSVALCITAEKQS